MLTVKKIVFLKKKIKVIIIGIEPNFDKNEIQLDEINKYIFINKDKQEIKKRYSSFSSKNACYNTIRIVIFIYF